MEERKQCPVCFGSGILPSPYADDRMPIENCIKCGGKGRIMKELDDIERVLNDHPWTLEATIEGLKYIASSPSEKHGGFHENAIDTAKAALHWLGVLEEKARHDTRSIRACQETGR